MIRFMLFSEKIYEVSLDEWLIIEKWLKDMATIVITEVTLEIENIQEKKILCASQLLQELGLNPPYFVGECLINNKQLNKEHLSEAHS